MLMCMCVHEETAPILALLHWEFGEQYPCNYTLEVTKLQITFEWNTFFKFVGLCTTQYIVIL